MKHVIAFTQGINVPSARFRVEQYKPLFESHNILLTILPAKVSAYPPADKYKRPAWLAAELFHRTKQLLTIPDAGAVIMQRELISTLPSLERFIRKPMILDVDDAIFLRKKGIAAKYLAKSASHIVCGNTFLADYFSQYNNKVSIISTPVDTIRFKPLLQDEKLIGWSGSSSGFKYLYEIESALAVVLKKNPEWKLLIVSDKTPAFTILPRDKIIFETWSTHNEVSSIQKMTIGIMPLDNSLWTRGKCSYKMMLYMACGLPVVVSDVGMNSELLKEGHIGYGANNSSDWVDALNALIKDFPSRFALGKNGRELIENKYSLTSCAKEWTLTINSIIE